MRQQYENDQLVAEFTSKNEMENAFWQILILERQRWMFLND